MALERLAATAACGGHRVCRPCWFAYFSADSSARESVDEVYVPGVKPGDDCTAVYPVDNPELGALRLTDRAPGSQPQAATLEQPSSHHGGVAASV